ncbi:unnamed protein product [Musa textilis]
MAWNDGAAEFGEWWWCLWGVEEEKLSGWFPFVDEDFLCSDTSGLERWGIRQAHIWIRSKIL